MSEDFMNQQITVKQLNTFDIDEEGIEAAAVTVIKGLISPGEVIPQLEDIHVDHPFMYFVRHKNTGTILNAGCITKI